jgi:hypothetical protein
LQKGLYGPQHLTQKAQLAPLITRHPTQAQIAAACMKPLLQGENCNQPVDVILDGRWHNLASLETPGVDATLEHVLESAWGRSGSSLNDTYTIDQRERITPSASVLGLVDAVGNPPSLRLVGTLAWSRRRWTIKGALNHTGGSGRLAHTQFNLGLNNALDQRPPFVNQFDLTSGALGYDPANASLLGRQVSLQFFNVGDVEPATSFLNLHGNRNPPSPGVHARPQALSDK